MGPEILNINHIIIKDAVPKVASHHLRSYWNPCSLKNSIWIYFFKVSFKGSQNDSDYPFIPSFLQS